MKPRDQFLAADFNGPEVGRFPEKKVSVWAVLAGALLRCPSLVWLATRRSERLALHPASTAQTGTFFPGNRLGGKREATRFRTIWISDIHLGTTGCQAGRLLEFLRATESETLYLVGDVIDGWQLQRRWYWDQTHNNVVQTVLKKAKKGTEVIFVPGNHDEAIRQFIDLDFGGIKIRDELVHVTAQGKRMLVLHGDRFDGVIACAKWLAYVGDSLYTMILKFNQVYNGWRARAGLPYWSLSQYLKLKVKNAVSYISSFEHALAAEAKKKGLDGVICGHIHKPEIRDIDGITYCNDGDWVESLSALVEDHSGELRLVTWQEIVRHAKQVNIHEITC